MTHLHGKTCFVGIGAQKAGTNWLAKYLTSHPQVCFSPIKELHYFDWRFLPENCGGWHREFSNRLEKIEEQLSKARNPEEDFNAALLRKRLEMADRPEAYLEFFDQLIRPEHAAFGEISPSYSMMPAAGFGSMKRMLPEPRLIWILRNPADRYWSQLRFTMQQRDDFSAEEQFVTNLNSAQFVLRTDYSRTFTNVFSEFAREEVLVVFFENLFFGDNRDAELNRITDYLGIDSHPANFEERIAASIEVPLDSKLRQKAVQRFTHVYRDFAEHFGPLPESWIEDLKMVK